jgi:peptidoglycan/LPS O-acetylase OafA/YrhL
MMFYALFPLLASRKCGSWAAIGAAIVSILGVAPAVRAWLPGSPSLLEQFAALNAVQQLPAFFCGMLIYRWTHGAPSAREAWTLAIGLGLIAALAVAIGEARLGVPMLVVLAETALVRWALAGAHHARVLGLLGRNSYVIYLSHFALFMGLHPLLPRGPGWTLIGFVLVAAGSCLLSEAFERTIGRAIHDWVARRTGTGRQAGGSQPKPRNTTPP